MDNTTKHRRFLLVSYLGQGMLPFEQWSCVFSNTELHGRPGLICKSFTVWFPTMLDFLNTPQELKAHIRENDDEEAEEIINLILKMEDYFKYFLSLYSREEQIFINDRRLQNVHGILSIFRLDKIHTKYYDSHTNAIQKEHIEADDYHEIMKSFYPELQTNTMNLRNRLVTAERFVAFGEFYNGKLKTELHLINLAKQLGVYGEA